MVCPRCQNITLGEPDELPTNYDLIPDDDPISDTESSEEETDGEVKFFMYSFDNDRDAIHSINITEGFI